MRPSYEAMGQLIANSSGVKALVCPRGCTNVSPSQTWECWANGHYDTHEQHNFDDVKAFQYRFGLPVGDEPQLLPMDQFTGRVEMMLEELTELMRAQRNAYALGAHIDGNLAFRPKAIAEIGDALVDLVYFALGTAVMMGLPWQALWNEVQRANMAKVPITSATDSKRNNVLDVKKPIGWLPPDLEAVIAAYLHKESA